MSRTAWAVWAALLVAGPGYAEGDAPREERFRKNLEAWQAMSPEERETVKRRYEVWKKLRPEEKETIARQIARIETMPAEDQEAIRLRLARWSTLPPQDRKRVEDRIERMKRAEEKKRPVVQAVGELVHLLPPETRRALRELDPERKRETLRHLSALFAHMTPAEREELAKLPPDQRSRRLLALMTQHQQKLERILDGIGPAVAATDEPRGERREIPSHLRRYYNSLSLEEQARIEEKLRSMPPGTRYQARVQMLEQLYRRAHPEPKRVPPANREPRPPADRPKREDDGTKQ